MESPVGEDNWIAFVDQQLREAADLEARVRVVETFQRAVAAEPGSLRVWIARCEFFWSLYKDCQPSSDAGWSPDDQQLGREMFTLDAALSLWQQGYEAVQYRLSDSHELWDRWVSLEMELLATRKTDLGVRRITQLFKNRLTVPHSAWDTTAQRFSSFLSEHNPDAYETEMAQVTKDAAEAKRLYQLRSPLETQLAAAERDRDAAALRSTMAEYIEWELRHGMSKRARPVDYQICLGLFSRALTGPLASDENAWLNFIVFVSTSHTALKAGNPRFDARLVPNMLDVLQLAVHHLPWSGAIWARYILAAEEAGLSFTDIERIKHAATNCSHLDRNGMSAVLEMYSAWCGYLKRTAMNPTATEEAIDVAEVGLPSALEDVKHWGKRKYGDEYQGDPDYRLEKILIQFLTERKEDIEGARGVWEQMSRIPLHANSYDFWLNWFLWEMVVFSSSKSKTRSPTPATLAQGLRVPSFATRVFTRALKVETLDWPERVMEIYVKHCNDYELAETLRQAQDTIYKTRKGVAKRREREAREARERAEAAAQQEAAFKAQPTEGAADQPMTDAGADAVDAASPSSKRKREASPSDDERTKRAKSEADANEKLRRDRENTSIFVANLPEDVTQTKIRHFFRDYGHINNIDVQRANGEAVALVEFRAPDDARSALLRDQKYFGDRVIRVTAATDCTLFVTNYPPEADEHFIRSLFKGCGEIHGVRFPSLKYNTKRRFCYVTFRDSAAAAAASKLDGKALEGGKFKLQAKISDPGAKQARHGAQMEDRELHVVNLPRNVSDDDVKGLFDKAGKVTSVRVLRNMAGKSFGSAFVVMETKEEAQEAIKTLDKVIFGNHPLKVELSRPPGHKVTATSRADSAGPADASSPGESPASGTASTSTPSAAELEARTIAVLGIPDTVTGARVRSVLAPAGHIVKMVLHPKHGGAVVEFGDAATAGKAALVIDGTEIDAGKKLRTGTVAELFKEKAEKRIDRIDVPSAAAAAKKPTARDLMPPPMIRRQQVLGKGGAKRGLGFVGAVNKTPNGSTAGAATTAPAAGTGKSNADFKKMFLEGKRDKDGADGSGEKAKGQAEAAGNGSKD